MNFAAMENGKGIGDMDKAFLLTKPMKKVDSRTSKVRESRFQPVEQVLARFENLDEMFAAA